MLILFMPNPSQKIYDIERRNEFLQVVNLNPYPLLSQRRTEMLNMYYKGPEYGEMLFTFKLKQNQSLLQGYPRFRY